MSVPGPHWLPIDTAPRDGTHICVYAPTMGESVAWWLDAAEVWAEELGSGYMAPYQDWTHWRPKCGDANHHDGDGS